MKIPILQNARSKKAPRDKEMKNAATRKNLGSGVHEDSNEIVC